MNSSFFFDRAPTAGEHFALNRFPLKFPVF